MDLDAAWSHTEMLQQFGTHQMRGFIKDISQTHIDVGFAKIDRVQLGMTVGEMQQRNIAKLGNHIQNRLQPARRTPGVTLRTSASSSTTKTVGVCFSMASGILMQG